MAASLLELWQAQPSFIEGKSFRQIIQFAGEGKLRDGKQASSELRAWLAAVALERLRACAEECLTSSFDESGFALQDVVNQIGVRLGFAVQPGLYRGTKNEIGFDGLWRSSSDGHTHVVEVKTTDTYRINLDTLADYRQALVEAGTLVEETSSILIIVGRQDTGDLEAQIRGSRHAWDMRLISIDSLQQLASIKEQLSDWATSTRINQLLRPLEYTKLDGIVELLFATSRDLEEHDSPADTDETEPPNVPPVCPTASPLEQWREVAFKRVADKRNIILVKKGRALRSTSDGQINLVGLVSKRYEGSDSYGLYWYGLTMSHRGFLLDAPSGCLILACADSGTVLALDRDKVLALLPTLGTTPPHPQNESEVRHWHFTLYDYGNKVELVALSPNPRHDLASFMITSDS